MHSPRTELPQERKLKWAFKRAEATGAERLVMVGNREWEDGEQDEVGWITPDNLSGVRRMDQVEERAQDDSHVACATLDGAMQNVLLQMGLRVIDTDGYVVKNVKQFVLKCHACYKICQDTDKRFCPGRAGVV